MQIINNITKNTSAKTAKNMAETATFLAEKWRKPTKNLVKTLLTPIDNQYALSFCQDLPGTTVMNYNKFCIKNFCQDFICLNYNKFQNFCQDLSGFEKEH